MARWFWNKKDTVEDSLSLSISWLKKNNYFYGRRFGIITWSSDGKEIASIPFVIDVDEDDPRDNCITLTYGVTDRHTGRHTGQKESIQDRIDIDSTPCNFGGVRYWFVCPSCGRRAGKIHLAPGRRHFLCRNCSDPTYRSCQESDKRVSALFKYLRE